LFHLYDNFPQQAKRIDIKESKNLAESLPEKAQELKTELMDELIHMGASFPYFNPHYKSFLPNKEKILRGSTT
tara:strand:- start:105 stop:323 length:219 start_codon:yes stop_codon:yes gene_type:complete